MFGKKAYVGISITDQAIKVAWIKPGKRRASFRAHGIERLEAGIIENGKVMDEAQFLEALHRLVKRYKFKGKKVHLSLPSSLSTIRFLNFPVVAKRKLSKLIRFEVMHNMFLPYDDPIYDYSVLPTFIDAEITPVASTVSEDEEETMIVERQNRIMLVTASKASIMQYTHLLKKAKLKVKSIELDALALYRFLYSTNDTISQKTCMILNVSNDQTDVSIFNQGYLKLSRSIDINLALASTTTYHYEFNELASEMERILNFYTYSMNNRQDEVETIYMFGDSEQLSDVAEHLSEVLNIEVLQGSEFGFATPVALNDAYAVPAGLSLKGVV